MDQRFFAGPLKKYRERCQLTAFLRCLGVEFLHGEIRPCDDRPGDLDFRCARFELTEVYDEGRKRGTQYRQRRERRKCAKSVDEVRSSYQHRQRVPYPEFVARVTDELAKKVAHYDPNELPKVDALAYFNLQEKYPDLRSPLPASSELRQQGWRSVSVVTDLEALVLHAASEAPAFLRDAVGQTRSRAAAPGDIFQLEEAYLHPDFTRFYDWSYSERKEDIPFYVRLARECGSPVLEVACGTARVLIPLAREGFEVVGIDFSEHMLAIAREKLEKESPEVRRRVSLVQADMREFDLGKVRGQTATIRPVVSVPEFPGREFAGVFVPNASVFHLRDGSPGPGGSAGSHVAGCKGGRQRRRATEDPPYNNGKGIGNGKGGRGLSQCFGCLYRHTRPGGLAVVDVVAPGRMAHQEVGKQISVREDINPATGLFTQELNRKLNMDRDAQIVRVEHVYVEIDGDDEKRFTFEQDYRWVEEQEGVELLREAGFDEVETLGDHEGRAFSDESERLILLARKA